MSHVSYRLLGKLLCSFQLLGNNRENKRKARKKSSGKIPSYLCHCQLSEMKERELNLLFNYTI